MRNYISTIYCILFISAIVSAVNYPQPTCYKKTARVASCTNKYAVMPGHMNCRFPLSGIPDTASGEAEIVHIHNRLRASVIPTAGNMMELKYASGLEHTAERWTRLCSTENSWFERTTPGAYIPGQNTYRNLNKVPWKDVLNVWIAENASFTYKGSSNKKDRVGNYTQMISANTTTLGCGVSNCHGYYLYMCLYAPILSPADINTPYKESKVPCNNTQENLCNCNGKLCLGGSKLNVTTCVCDCITTMGASNMYNGTVCDLSCIGPNGDDHSCGRYPFTNDSCDTNMETMFHCPYMCYVCPYAGQGRVNGEERLPWEKGLPNCTTTNSTTTLPRTTENKAGIRQSSLYTTTRYTTATGTTVTGSLHNRENSASGVMQNCALSMVFLAWCLSRN